MRVSLDPAYILHSRQYRESSLLLEALSCNHGRVGLVARGARGARSRWKNMLQPFRPLLLSWNQKGELGTLVEADQVAPLPAMAGEALFCGLYVNELAMSFLHRQDPHPGLFEHYSQLIMKLSSGSPPELQLRLFEERLLRAVGFGLQLECDFATGDELSAEACYQYVPESGPLRRDPSQLDAKERVSGAALLALKSGNVSDDMLRELKLLMRKLIRFHLGDRKLKSQSLFL